MSAGEPLEARTLVTKARSRAVRFGAGSIAPVKVALVVAMCLVCGMVGLLGGVLASGGHVAHLFQTVTRAGGGHTATQVRTRAVTSTATVTATRAAVTRVVTRPAATVVTTDTVPFVTTVTVTTTTPATSTPPPTSGTTGGRSP